MLRASSNQNHFETTLSEKSKYPTISWNGEISYEVKNHEIRVDGVIKEIYMPFMSGAPLIDMSDIADQVCGQSWVLASIIAGSSRPAAIQQSVNCEINQNRQNSFAFRSEKRHFIKNYLITIRKRITYSMSRFVDGFCQTDFF